MATLRDFDKDTRQYFYEKAWKEVIEENWNAQVSGIHIVCLLKNFARENKLTLWGDD